MMKELVYKILWSTIEDFVGLWEINWEVNTFFPNNSSSQNKEFARKILVYFIENDLVKLYFDKWGGDELSELNKKEALEITREEKFWDPPSINDRCIKVGSTEKGEMYYKKESIKDIIL